MFNNLKSFNPRLIILLTLLIVFTLFAGLVISQTKATISLGLAVVALIFTISFINTEVALYILIFSMLLSPEIIVGRLGEPGVIARGLTLRLEDFLLIIIGFSWFAKTAIFKELGLILRTPLNRPILVYLLACFFSTAVGMMVGRVNIVTGFFFVLKYFEYFIVYFMVVNYLETEKQLKRFLTFVFIVCSLISLYAIIQIPSGERVTAPFEGEWGEPNTLGGYLVFMLALIAGIFLRTSERRRKLLWALLGIIVLIPFLYTLSRASYLGAIAMYLALIIFNDKKKLLISILLLGIIFLPLTLPSVVKDRVLETFYQTYYEPNQVKIFGIRLDTSTSIRLLTWKAGLLNWIKHPLLGFGVTGFSFMDAQYVRVLIETGILGLTAFIWLLVSIFKIAYNRYKEMDKDFYKGLTLGYLAGFIGLTVHAIGTNTFIIVRIMEPFWLITGIIIMLPQIVGKEKALELK